MAAAPKSTTVAAEAGPTDIASILKDVALTALLALVILAPIVGLKTDAATTGLVLVQRWGTVFALVAIIAVGRLLLSLYAASKPAGTSIIPKLGIGQALEPYGKYVGVGLLGIAILLPVIAGMSGTRERQIMDIAILMLTYIMLGWGLNIVVGLAGLLDLGYVAFYAVGAYSFALLAQWYGLSFWICLPLAGILAAFWGIILGFPVLRLRGDYLAIVTLAFGEIIRLILINWQDVTGGPGGLGRIPGPTFPAIEFAGWLPKLSILQFTDGEPNSFHKFFGIDYVPVHRFIFL
jgi:branched-chain amino acid transport system permease protein